MDGWLSSAMRTRYVPCFFDDMLGADGLSNWVEARARERAVAMNNIGKVSKVARA